MPICNVASGSSFGTGRDSNGHLGTLEIERTRPIANHFHRVVADINVDVLGARGGCLLRVKRERFDAVLAEQVRMNIVGAYVEEVVSLESIDFFLELFFLTIVDASNVIFMRDSRFVPSSIRCLSISILLTLIEQ